MQKPINFKNITIGAIPTSYLNSLTYEEQILMLVKAFNELNENVTEYTDSEIKKLKNELIILINKNLELSKKYTDYNVLILNEKIADITLGDVNIRNPINGLFENVQKVIDDIYYANVNGITASRFDSLELSALEYDNKNITASDFDRNSNEIL